MRPKRIVSVVLDPSTRSITFARVTKLKHTTGGTVATTQGHGSSIVQSTWMRDRKFPMSIFAQKRYIILKEGDPRPLNVASDFKPLDYDSGMFQAAIRSDIATKILNRNRMDWRTLLLIMLGALVLLLGFVLAVITSTPPTPVTP